LKTSSNFGLGHLPAVRPGMRFQQTCRRDPGGRPNSNPGAPAGPTNGEQVDGPHGQKNPGHTHEGFVLISGGPRLKQAGRVSVRAGGLRTAASSPFPPLVGSSIRDAESVIEMDCGGRSSSSYGSGGFDSDVRLAVGISGETEEERLVIALGPDRSQDWASFSAVIAMDGKGSTGRWLGSGAP